MKNTKPEPSNHGIVVEHKDSGLRYASLDANFDPENERYVRDLRPEESVLSYRPKTRVEYDTYEQEVAEQEAISLGLTELERHADSEAAKARAELATQTEGAASADSPEKKEGN